jgi:hypothetical protein
MPTKTYSVYLTTQAAAGSIYAPIDETNLARVTWAINWTGIFNGNVNKPAKVRFVLRSLSQSGVLTWAANLGTLRAQGLSTAFSNSQNGLLLGEVYPIDNPVAGNPNHIMYGDTTSTIGASTIIPSGYQQLTLLFLDDAEVIQVNIVDYQIIMYFDIDVDDPL